MGDRWYKEDKLGLDLIYVQAKREQNGKRLVQLMIDHDLGISLENLHQLKEVDMAYTISD